MASDEGKDKEGSFKEFLEGTLAKDSDSVPRRDLDAGASAPAAEPVRDEASGGVSLKEILLGPGPRFEGLAPKRGRLRRRPPVGLD
jgi:hypothetical protein